MGASYYELISAFIVSDLAGFVNLAVKSPNFWGFCSFFELFAEEVCLVLHAGVEWFFVTSHCEPLCSLHNVHLVDYVDLGLEGLENA